MKISLEQAREYGRRVLAAQGVPEDIARDVADHLVESDRVGYTSHGLSILTNYRRVLADGLAQADGRPELVNDVAPCWPMTATTAWASTWARWSSKKPSSARSSMASAS